MDLSRPASLAMVEVVDGAVDGQPDDPPDGSPADGDEPDAVAPVETAAADVAPADAPVIDAPASGPEAGPPDAAPDLAPDVAPDVAPDTGGCTSEAQCESGYSCVSQMCTRLPGLALHWKLDETAGTLAGDASGNGFDGTYGGATGMPASSSSVPTLQFPDPGSRAFTGGSRHEVRLSSLPAILHRNNDVTLSAWFRASQITDGSGYAEIASIGDGYVLYIGNNQVGLSKRLVNRDYTFCLYNTTSHLDDRWHHLAAIATTSGMKVFLDGTERCNNNQGGTITYSSTPVVLVGRDPDPAYGWYFDGFIDDVRAYTRALTSAEISKLAAGGR